MRQLLLVIVLGAAGALAGGCSLFTCASECGPEPVCEPVYVSPCCPAPSQGLGYGAGPGAPASACGGGRGCGA